MNYQDKLTQIKNAEVALKELKKEIIISERVKQKLLNSSTVKNSLAFYRQSFKLDKQYLYLKKTIKLI